MPLPSPFSPESGPTENRSSSNGEPRLYDRPPNGRSASPLETLKVFWGGKWLILGTALLFAAAAYAYWERQPKQYRTSSVLLLNESKQFDRLDLSLPVDQQTNTQRDLYFLRHSQVFAEMVARRVVDSLQSGAATPASLLATDEGHVPAASNLAGRIRESVRVRRDSRDVPAIKISVTSAHPQAATLITNTYAETYVDHLRQSSNARLRTSRRFLEGQKKELRGRLQSIEDTIATYVRQQGQAGLLANSDSSAGAGIVGEARQIAGEISDLRLRKEKIQLELNVEQTLLDTTRARLARIRPNLADRASSSTAERLQQTQEKIASLQRRIQQIEVQNETLSANLASQLEQMKARVQSLRQKSQRLAKRYVEEALSTDGVNPLGKEGNGLSAVVDLQRQITDHRIRITTLKARRDALTNRIQVRKGALRNAPDQTLARLKRRKNTTEELFVALSKSLQKIQVSAESTPEQGQVLQKAHPPSVPVGPNVRQNVMMALLLGGMVGAGVVFLYGRLDDRIDEPEDLKEMEIGLFGVVPAWAPDENAHDQSTPDVGPTGHASCDWTGIAAPCSPTAEAYRHVATNLRLGIPASLEVLLVTSPHPKEGKSTTVANLGVCLSEAGKDVLLIDADLYGSTLHRSFGCTRDPGLTDWLADGTEAVQVVSSSDETTIPTAGDGAFGLPELKNASRRTKTGRLGLLTSGTSVPQPSLLLQENHVQALLQELKQDWDLVLLDTPPILTYDAASRLAALSDVALLLASAGTTTRAAYTEALDRTRTLCSGPVGSLLNRYDDPNGTIYGYSSYSVAKEPDSSLNRLVRGTKQGFRHLATGR